MGERINPTKPGRTERMVREHYALMAFPHKGRLVLGPYVAVVRIIEP